MACQKKVRGSSRKKAQLLTILDQNFWYLVAFKKTVFSKMTFAHISEATALSQRVFHQSQNTFNRIQNSFMTNEIHDQGQFSSMISSLVSKRYRFLSCIFILLGVFDLNNAPTYSELFSRSIGKRNASEIRQTNSWRRNPVFEWS